MMLVPRRKNWDLFDDFFEDFPVVESKCMKTDIKEHENNYELIVDLPGFSKDNINISIENGYLEISAKTTSDKEENEKGKYLRRERFEGEYRRSFYIGDNITEEEIKASFKNGILKISVPKVKENPKANKKYIEIDE